MRIARYTIIGLVLAWSPMPAQMPDAPVKVSSGVMAANRIKGSSPHFSEEAKATSGQVVLHVIIGKDGHVKDATVVSGPEAKRAAMLEAIRTWEYKPYLLNGEPVEVDTTIAPIYDFGR